MLESGAIAALREQLNALRNEISAQAGKKVLTTAQAEILIAEIDAILSNL